MNDRSASATVALDIMRQWQWQRGDPDGNFWPVSVELSLAINRLAMEGIQRPQDTILSLLCRGDLLASGDYQWQKYQWGNEFQLEDSGGEIKQKQWRDLADLINWERQELKSGAFLLDQAELVKLGHEPCYPYQWEFPYNRFSTSLCPPDTPVLDPTYLEEWYSAWNIEVSPAWNDQDSLDSDPEPVVPASNRGGAPRKWDWDGALLHLAALAHHGENGLFREDGSDPNQSDIARHLQAWFIDTCHNSPENSQLREYGKRFVTELNALKLRHAKNLQSDG